MSRGVALLIVLACLVTIQPAWASQPAFRLQVVPAVVYKVDDSGNAHTSSFVFNIAVICTTDCGLIPLAARVELSSAGSTVERQEWTSEQLAKIKRVSYRIQPNTPLASPIRLVTLPEAFDLRFYFRYPHALAIDSADVRLTVGNAKGRRAEQMLRIPIRYYEQKTSLTVPHPGVRPDWSWYIPLHDPAEAHAGNCVVIDHGKAEYSVMSHMQEGSGRVKVKDRVAAGQVIGKLGNSGDSFGPHLHYQLQSGPQIFHDQSLPFRFHNIDDPLRRGTDFDAK